MRAHALFLLSILGMSSLAGAEFEIDSSRKYRPDTLEAVEVSPDLLKMLHNSGSYEKEELEMIQALSTGIWDSWYLTYIANDVKIVKKEARSAFVETVNRLTPPELAPIQRRQFISYLAGTNLSYYPTLIYMIESLSVGLKGEEWLSVAKGAAVALKSNAERLLGNTDNFISSIQDICRDRSANDKRWIMIGMSALDPAWWGSFAKYANNHDFFNEISLATFVDGTRKEARNGGLKTKDQFIMFINKCWLDTKKSYDAAMNYCNTSKNPLLETYYRELFSKSKQLSQPSLEKVFMTMKDLDSAENN